MVLSSCSSCLWTNISKLTKFYCSFSFARQYIYVVGAQKNHLNKLLFRDLSLGLTLPLAIVAICFLKCRVATNISHWLKVHSRWFKNYIFAKNCILISWFSNNAFIILSLFIIASYFTLWMLEFFNTIRVSNSLDPKCLQRLSADNKSCH